MGDCQEQISGEHPRSPGKAVLAPCTRICEQNGQLTNSFRDSEASDIAFASNLLGIMVGEEVDIELLNQGL